MTPSQAYRRFARRVRAAVAEAVRKGLPPDQLEAELARTLDREGRRLQEAESEAILAEARAQHAWLSERTLSPEARRLAAQFVERAGQDVARVRDQVEHRLLRDVMRAVREGRPAAEVEAAAARRLSGGRHRARTLAETALGAFDRAGTLLDAQDAAQAGVEVRFRYVGPAADRDFCRQRLEEAASGETFTLEEVRAMDNGQGLPVELYRGGFSCRHQWRPVSETEGGSPPPDVTRTAAWEEYWSDSAADRARAADELAVAERLREGLGWRVILDKPSRGADPSESPETDLFRGTATGPLRYELKTMRRAENPGGRFSKDVQQIASRSGSGRGVVWIDQEAELDDETLRELVLRRMYQRNNLLEVVVLSPNRAPLVISRGDLP